MIFMILAYKFISTSAIEVGEAIYSRKCEYMSWRIENKKETRHRGTKLAGWRR